jgi:ATP-dependent protease Clp ATPase subunit
VGMDDFRCSFCSQARRDVRKLISGPRVFICDGCVTECVDSAGLADLPRGASVSVGRRGTPAMTSTPTPAPCSFCGGRTPDPRLVFQGEESRICAWCIGLCLQILAEEFPKEWTAKEEVWPDHGE